MNDDTDNNGMPLATPSLKKNLRPFLERLSERCGAFTSDDKLCVDIRNYKHYRFLRSMNLSDGIQTEIVVGSRWQSFVIWMYENRLQCEWRIHGLWRAIKRIWTGI